MSETEQENGHHHGGPLSFRWTNFRAFQDTKWVELRPLVVVIGPNNSGKSSLVAPLLALKQTAASFDPDTPFVSRGSQTNIGAFRDFVYKHDTSRSVDLQVKYHSHSPHDGMAPLEECPPGAVHWKLSQGSENQTLLDEVAIYDTYDRLHLRRTRKDGKYTLDDFSLDPTSESEQAILKRILDSEPRGFMFDSAPALYRSEGGPSIEDVCEEFRRRVILYSSIVDTARLDLLRTLGTMSYLGPMRDRPRRYYEHLGTFPVSVGSRGEHTAEALFRQRNDGLMDEVSKWISRFGLGDTLTYQESIDGEVFSLQLRIGGTAVNIADCGFGVSQVLPILVEGLSESSDHFLIKQPEIHLNPAQQCTLAEFLIEAVVARPDRAGKSVVVETHSEHMLLTWRRLIAQQRLRASDVALYFTERVADDATVREIPISDLGHIEADEWPREFFGEGLRQALALAEAQGKRLKPQGERLK